MSTCSRTGKCRIRRISSCSDRRLRRKRDFSVRIQDLEDEGDRIYRRAVADLFGGQHPAMDVLKWKDIIDEAEAAIDRLQNVGNVLEAIALKQS